MMQMKRRIFKFKKMHVSRALLGFSLLLTIGCGPHPSINPHVCTSIDLVAEVRLLNGKGENLLDPTTTGYYDQSYIKLFYVSKGVKTEVYNPMLDTPRNFKIIDNGIGEPLILLYLNANTSDLDWSTTLVQWTERDVDTLRAQIVSTHSGGCESTYFSKVQYNGQTKYDMATYQPVTWGNAVFYKLITVTK